MTTCTPAQRPSRRLWTEAEVTVLRELYPSQTAADIAARLGRELSSVQEKAWKLGLRKTSEWIAERSRRNSTTNSACIASRFPPGLVPWNKGVPGSTGRHPASAANHFVAGHQPHTWKPVGTLRITNDGVLQRKLTDTGYSPRDWVSVHRTVWEAAHGPVPAGMVVVFQPGRKTTELDGITPDALECISRRELMARNSTHRLGADWHRVHQLRGCITRQINRRLRQAAEESVPT